MDSTTVTAIVVALLGSGLLNIVVNHFYAAKEKKENRDNGTQEALRLLMKDRLRFLCNHYIDQGWIYSDELDDIMAMHKCYHDDLKGNGYLDVLMGQVTSLEIRGIGVK